MKLQLNKKQLKNLSQDAQVLPFNMTPNVVGAGPGPSPTASCGCDTSREECGRTGNDTDTCQ